MKTCNVSLKTAHGLLFGLLLSTAPGCSLTVEQAPETVADSRDMGLAYPGRGVNEEAVDEGAETENDVVNDVSDPIDVAPAGSEEGMDTSPIESRPCVHMGSAHGGDDEVKDSPHADDDTVEDDEDEEHDDPTQEPERHDDEAQAGDGQGDDVITLPLRVVALSSDEYAFLDSSFTDEEIIDTVSEVNLIWAQAGIQFDLVSIERRPALAQADYAESFRQGNRSPRSLRALYDVEEVRPDGWTLIFIEDMGVMPPGVYFCDQGVTVVGRYFGRQQREVANNVVAHELGHALSLEHACGHGENLMCADGMAPTLLWENQIQQVRLQARTGTPHICQGR